MIHLHHVVELAGGFTVTFDRNPQSTAAQIIARDPAGGVVDLWLDAHRLVNWAQDMAALQHGSATDDAETYADTDQNGTGLITVTLDSRIVFVDETGPVETKVDTSDLMLLINLATACSAGL